VSEGALNGFGQFITREKKYPTMDISDDLPFEIQIKPSKLKKPSIQIPSWIVGSLPILKYFRPIKTWIIRNIQENPTDHLDQEKEEYKKDTKLIESILEAIEDLANTVID
jgi:hypothetical protein